MLGLLQNQSSHWPIYLHVFLQRYYCIHVVIRLLQYYWYGKPILLRNIKSCELYVTLISRTYVFDSVILSVPFLLFDSTIFD